MTSAAAADAARQAVALAAARGLEICPAARELGRRDAKAGRRWAPPPGVDPLAYALGYAEP